MMTGLLIILCIAGTALSGFGARMPGDNLLAPTLVHFGVVHLLFNMLILYRLGNCVENKIGTMQATILIVAAAFIANVAQHAWLPTIHFGGVSGVIYALLGYAWARGLVTPATVLIALVWLILCMGGLVGAVADAAHAAGLVVGLAVGLRDEAEVRGLGFNLIWRGTRG